ncbi:Uncharacterised protein [Clostridium baratii]|uniref:hypothetical protein n=1 Tax=Clostridium baratii TaxID=1561 RepID=UPI0006C063C6|nr:hypothetical protein [Clostridium baratii]CUO92131.1 Uncharacterised protein [Clostridium baratii]
MDVDITVIVGMFCTVIGALIGIWKAKKDGDRDTREDAARDTTVNVKLEYISKGVDDIRIDNKVRDKQMLAFTERLVAVEKSAASAHHRIDNLEEKR